MERLRAFWNKGWMGKVVLGVGGLLAFCCVASVIVTALSPRSTPTAQAPASGAAPAQQATVAPAQATAMPVPTAAPEPTDAPEPTAMPEPTAAPASSTGVVGDRLEANGIALTVIKAERVKELGQFFKASAGNIYVVAEVLIENVSAEKAPYNLFYFKVKDSEGFEFNVTAGADQSISSGELAKGEKVRGNVAFEVKEASKELVMTYEPITFGNTDPIKVALP